jgi:hypothetical protein
MVRPASEEGDAPAERREQDASGERTSGPPAKAEATLVAEEGVNEGVDELVEESPESDGGEDRRAGRAPPRD